MDVTNDQILLFSGLAGEYPALSQCLAQNTPWDRLWGAPFYAVRVQRLLEALNIVDSGLRISSISFQASFQLMLCDDVFNNMRPLLESIFRSSCVINDFKTVIYWV